MTDTIQNIRFAVRRRTAASWASINEVLLLGEIGLERDTLKFKFGDGATVWNSLPYYGANLWQPLNAYLTDIAELPDPGADRLYFWDESLGTAGGINHLTLGTGLTITGTTIDAAGGGGGAMILLGTATVSGSAATVLTLSGLNLSAYKAFVIIVSLKNNTASLAIISCYFNADTTDANYDNQNLSVSGGTTSSGRANAPVVGVLDASSNMVSNMVIANDGDGKPTVEWRQRSGQTTTINMRSGVMMWRTAANVTSITLSSDVASALAVGSLFHVFGVS